MKTAAFIGVGNMGGALARAACKALGGGQVAVTDHDEAKARAFADEMDCTALRDNLAAVREAKFVVLGVKPYLVAQLLREIAPALREAAQAGEAHVLVSMAAGVTINAMEAALGLSDVPVIRILPNIPAAVGQGVILTVPNSHVTEADMEGFRQLMGMAGLVSRIPESQMDAAGTVTGCGPAFVYMFIEALADGGVLAGLPRAQAQEYAARCLMGSAALLLESGKHPGELKDQVCSPGGSTIEGVKALEDGGFRAAAMDAVVRAWKRTTELGKG